MSEPIVLIVEDDPALRDALAATVELAGFAVKSAADGTQAMQVLENQPVQLVVSDVQMDGMDGYTLLQKVKASIPQLPVVLMTAYGTIQKAVEAMRAGAADYLVKPFDAEALVEMLRNYLPDVGDDPEAAGVRLVEEATDVLDGAERRVEDVQVLVGALLESCSRLRILVTSSRAPTGDPRSARTRRPPSTAGRRRARCRS